jgi:predicted dehydrogenase
MKKKIGFIDYHIDEYHANNYPGWIRESKLSENFELAYAWQESQGRGLRSIEEWCDDIGDFTPVESIVEVVEKSDVIFVLAPSNPEVHERLSKIPLCSGKPVYIDKPFAPDKDTAIRLFEMAENNGTPLMSSSALRFESNLQSAIQKQFNNEDKMIFAGARGSGSSFEEYAIHQIEMIVALLGTGAERIMHCGNEYVNHMVIKYADDRRASMTLMPGQRFQISAAGEKENVVIDSMDDFFPNLIDAILEFFQTGEAPVPKEQTIEAISILEAGNKGLNHPCEWIAC